MLLELSNNKLSASVVEVQGRIRSAALEDEDKVFPSERLLGLAKRLKVLNVKVDHWRPLLGSLLLNENAVYHKTNKLSQRGTFCNSAANSKALHRLLRKCKSSMRLWSGARAELEREPDFKAVKEYI